jgi:UDP-N-acetylmuramoyl-tripeptide--D-alanyl-D-alanine ligase
MEATNQIVDIYKLFLQYPSVQTDTRKLQKGDIFFALSGPNFNGSDFAIKALELGASYAIVDKEIKNTDIRIITVPDTLIALQQLARYHRQQLNIPILAITGSNGKTTTKELVSTVLASSFITYTTQGNLNNHIGVPLTLLSIKPDAEIAVIEMGANHQREIAGYCEYTLPTHALITNCGKAHLEGFGGIEGVRKGKGELYDYIKANGGTVFSNWDYDYLQTMSVGINNLIKYGTIEGDIVGNVIESNPFLKVGIKKEESLESIATQLVGDYNLPNVLCAVAIGKYFKVGNEYIKSAIENYSPTNSRSQLIQKGTNSIILDAYNANPTSMKAAIENFANLDSDKKVLFIGGMMELGEISVEEHENIVELIKRFNWDNVVLVGGDFKRIYHPFIYYNSSSEAKEWFENQNFSNTYFLIKGSRSMQMEKIIQ